MEKNNGDNKQFGLMRMIIVFLSIIIVLLIVLIILMFNKSNDNKKLSDDNTYQVEKEKVKEEDNNTNQTEDEIVKKEENKDVDNNSSDESLTFKNDLKIDNELKNTIKEISIDIISGNPLFSTYVHENSGAFVELTFNMLPGNSVHDYTSRDKIPSPSDVGIDLSDDYDGFSGYVEAEALRKKYKEVFGNELVNSNYSSCPYMLYSSKYDRYYYISNCGGTGFGTYKYVYDYKVEDGRHLVYVASESVYDTKEPLGPNNYTNAEKFEIAFIKMDTGYVFDYSKRIN